MTVTRIFPRPSGWRRPHNAGTQLGASPGLLAAPRPMQVAEDFVTRYRAVRPALELHDTQGVLLLLFDPMGHLIRQGWLRATLDKTRAAIVGRHSSCGLPVPELCGDVSLRHLAVLVRAVDHDTTRIRALDLASGLGFSDEAGRQLQAVTAEGSVFLRVGALDLWLLTTWADDPPPASAEDAYRCIPPRVFVQERVGPPVAREAPWAGAFGSRASGATQVRSVVGPLVDAQRLCADDEFPVGRLVVRAGPDELTRAVGPTALARGLLVGRYDRCDLVRSRQEALSRVHLLIVRDGPDVLAIDTASSNGTELDGAPITQVPLRDGTTLVLPDDVSLSWRTEA